MIMTECVVFAHFGQCLDAGARAFDQGHDDGPVQQVDRRAMQLQQRVVQVQNRPPVRFFIARTGPQGT